MLLGEGGGEEVKDSIRKAGKMSYRNTLQDSQCFRAL